MKDTFAKIIETAEALDWRCNDDSLMGSNEKYIEFEQDTPAGEDFIFTAYGNTPEELARSVFEYAENFDITEHVQTNLGGRGAPGAAELVEDAKEIKKMLETLADALLTVSRGEEYKPQQEPEQNPKLTQLLELMKAHPELPIFPMVDSEVVGDDYGRWRGSWGRVSLQEVYKGKERIFFRDDEDDELIDQVLEDYLIDDQYINIADDIECMRDVFKTVPWEKCIVVNIDLPDD